MSDLLKRIKGTVSQYKDDSFEFKPYGNGEPVYEHSYKVGEAQISIHLDIDLSETCDYGQRIANFIIKTNQCLYINKDLVRRAARATAKPSKQ